MTSNQTLWTRDFILATVLNFFLILNHFVLMTSTTLFAVHSFDVSSAVGGFAASIFIIGTLIARLCSGQISRFFSLKKILIVGLICATFCSTLYFLVGDLASLMTLRIIHGFFYGLCSNSISTIGTALVPDSRKGEGVAYFMLSNTLGAAFGPSIGIALSSSGVYTGVFVCAIVVISISLLCSLPLRVRTNGLQNGPVVAETDPLFKRIVKGAIEPRAVGIAAVAGIIFFAYSSLLTYLSTFGQETGLQDAVNVFFLVYAGAMFISRPFTGKLFDRRGARIVMIPSFFLMMAGMVMLGTASSTANVLIAAALLGIGVGTIQSCGLTIAVQKAPLERLGVANATFFAALDTGVGLGPVVSGELVLAFGTSQMYVSMAAFGALALALYLAISRPSKNHRV